MGRFLKHRHLPQQHCMSPQALFGPYNRARTCQAGRPLTYRLPQESVGKGHLYMVLGVKAQTTRGFTGFVLISEHHSVPPPDGEKPEGWLWDWPADPSEIALPQLSRDESRCSGSRPSSSRYCKSLERWWHRARITTAGLWNL